MEQTKKQYKIRNIGLSEIKKLEKIKKIQINRLKWYKSRNWTKENLIKSKIFPKSFTNKYWNNI